MCLHTVDVKDDLSDRFKFGQVALLRLNVWYAYTGILCQSLRSSYWLGSLASGDGGGGLFGV